MMILLLGWCFRPQAQQYGFTCQKSIAMFLGEYSGSDKVMFFTIEL